MQAIVYIDIDNGMHCTGFPANEDIVCFYKQLLELPYLSCVGLHIYDGHINDKDFEQRKKRCENDFIPVREAINKIRAIELPIPKIVAGGSPTFTIHSLDHEIFCSPGTNILWDRGYSDLLKEQHFLHAAVIMTRIISKPLEEVITTDLGHKSVAAENPIEKRIAFC